MVDVAPIKGRMLRIVKLDTCGVPVTGADSLEYVSKGFISTSQETQYEDGEEFFERNADGDACVNEKDLSTLKRMQLTNDFCAIDPTIAAFLYSARLLDTTSPATTGTGFAVREGRPENRFSLEIWQRVAGSGACDPSGQQRYIYNAWPNVGNAVLGEYTIELGRSTLQFVAETQAAAEQWGSGIGTSWLPDGEVVDTDEHWIWNITTVAPPQPKPAGPLG